MTDSKQITIVTDSSLLDHDTGGGEHPEIPQRLEVITSRLAEDETVSLLDSTRPHPASREQICAFHNEAWLFRFEEAVLSGRTYIDHTDNQIGYESFTVALLSAGTGISGIDLLERKEAATVFCLTRPPGHHAEPDRPLQERK